MGIDNNIVHKVGSHELKPQSSSMIKVFKRYACCDQHNFTCDNIMEWTKFPVFQYCKKVIQFSSLKVSEGKYHQIQLLKCI